MLSAQWETNRIFATRSETNASLNDIHEVDRGGCGETRAAWSVTEYGN